MTERSSAQQLYSDQSCSNDIFTMFPTVQACIWSYSAVQCFALCVNESVYPSSLLSFNCCSKNKHEQASTQRSSGSQRHALWTLSPPSLVSAPPHNHNIMKMKCVRRQLSKWCNEGRWEQRLRWKIILQCTAALPWIRLIQLQICLCRIQPRVQCSALTFCVLSKQQELFLVCIFPGTSFPISADVPHLFSEERIYRFQDFQQIGRLVSLAQTWT